MSTHTRWLAGEIDQWSRDGIITAEQGARIRARYPEAVPAVSWGLVVFSGFGAVIVGLGVILLLAYNWDDIPKFGKLALVFGSTIAAHAAGVRLRAKEGWRSQLGEALSLLGSVLFGAGIWLIAQVYNIDEHFPNGFLCWGLGALALAWAMDSILQGLLAVVVLTFWGCAEVVGFGTSNDWSWVLIALGAGAMAVRRKSTLLLTVVLAALYVLILNNAGHWDAEAGAFMAAMALSVLLLAVRLLAAGGRLWPGAIKTLTFFGIAGFLICSFLLSFKGEAGDLLEWTSEHEPGGALMVYRWGLPAVALIAWVWLVARRLLGSVRRVPTEEWLCPIALVYCQGMAMTGVPGDSEFAAWVFNLVVLGVAAAWMVRGCRDGLLRPTILGSVVLAVLVFARYFDLFENLAVRGTVFLILGGLLFAEGFFYRKLRRDEASPEGGAS